MPGKPCSPQPPASPATPRFRAIPPWRLVDAVGAFVWATDLHGRVLEVNRSALDEAGIELEDVRDRVLWDCPWWEGSDEERRKLQSACEVARRGDVVRGEAVLKMAREERAVDLQVAPLRDARGRLVQLVLSAVDVTERRGVEADLKASESRRRIASEVARVGTLRVGHREQHRATGRPRSKRCTGSLPGPSRGDTTTGQSACIRTTCRARRLPCASHS